ncbi:MAG: phosphoribosylformylglycinamidine cyclo-ligase [Alphaproteobacteria bacterium]|nr:phosphoribosylformylglycinamidine cyclo-ligase [Alphaproteobacteria bacterium]
MTHGLGDVTINSLTYHQAGVDIDAGDAFVEAIKPLARRTKRPGSAAILGGFAALFDVKQAGFNDPLLVATTDGVGTKLKLAIACQNHHTIGIDLVAMCVNDLVVSGAKPLFFLDYFATSRLNPAMAIQVIEGIANACHATDTVLVGGETAEMPGLYQSGDYDLAGFAVGAIERDLAQYLTDHPPAIGDTILGLASHGLHSNGFSLVRKIVTEGGFNLAEKPPFASDCANFGQELLRPTCLYVKPLLPLINARKIKGLAHITGGGLVGNIPRSLPRGMGARLEGRAWRAVPVFGWLSQQGVATSEMARVFNCGIGMIAIVAPSDASNLAASLTDQGYPTQVIGQVVAWNDTSATPQIEISNLADCWV